MKWDEENHLRPISIDEHYGINFISEKIVKNLDTNIVSPFLVGCLVN
jgi:hypothetical protein